MSFIWTQHVQGCSSAADHTYSLGAANAAQDLGCRAFRMRVKPCERSLTTTFKWVQGITYILYSL